MTPETNPIVAFEQRGPITLAVIQETRMLDAINVAEFGRQLAERASALPAINLLLDFREVDYLSSAVLSELLRVNGIVEKNGGCVRLCGLASAIREVFQITNMEKIFTIYDAEDNADAVRRFVRSLDIERKEQSWNRLGKND
ncbi:MAG: STAS domain-containing protein [Nitrospiraceae bacterium]|nr:STAS domain-containing protein [Nitrospiraceae bacterium]